MLEANTALPCLLLVYTSSIAGTTEKPINTKLAQYSNTFSSCCQIQVMYNHVRRCIGLLKLDLFTTSMLGKWLWRLALTKRLWRRVVVESMALWRWVTENCTRGPWGMGLWKSVTIVWENFFHLLGWENLRLISSRVCGLDEGNSPDLNQIPIENEELLNNSTESTSGANIIFFPR